MRRNRTVPRGQVHRLTHTSKVLEGNLLGDPTERELHVYTPHGYQEGPRLPLLVDVVGFTGSGLGHTNWNPAKFVKDVSGLPVSVAHKMPIFLSAGDKDEVVPRKAADQSQHEMEHEGFKNLRYEHFDGGHQFYRPHLQAALDWFLEEKGKSGSSPSPFPSRR